jgi:periplasmic protein TonB
MSEISLNTFPAINTFHSPRSWFLALIVVLHVGFFFALNSGLSFSTLVTPPNVFKVSMIDERVTAPPPSQPILKPNTTWSPRVVARPPDAPTIEDTDPGLRSFSDPTPSPPVERSIGPAQPVIVEPSIPSSGLSEPIYPASEIRAEHSGTVLLSVEILPNGRVGEIRLVQSSGYTKLDQSALREARKWRFVPGSRDGVPVVRWKQVPVKFELNNRN